jgi:arabinofuranosyltransferase
MILKAHLKSKLALWLLYAAFAAGFGVLFCFSSTTCPLDDAYIHFRYAANLANGFGFAFNPGEPSFGTTSPLWVVLLASLIRWVNPVLLARAVAYFSLVAIMIFASLFVKESRVKALVPNPGTDFYENTRDNDLLRYGSLAAILILFSGNFEWIVYSGMESALWAALCMAAIYFSVREKPSWLGYIFLGLAVLTRFEAVMLIPVILVWQVFGAKSPLKILAGGLIAILIGCSFYLYSYHQIGQFFPTTRAGKLASDLFNSGFSIRGGWLFFARHIHYLWLAAPFTLLGLGFVLVGSLVWLLRGDWNYPSIGPFGVLVIFALAVFLYHDQFMRSTQTITPYHNMRYQVLFFPALGIGMSIVLAQLVHLWKNSRLKAIPLVLVSIILLGSFWWDAGKWKKLYAAQCKHIEDVHIGAAAWSKYRLEKNARIACFDIGSLGYFSDRYVIDLGGLVDPQAHRYLREKRMGPYLKAMKATHYIELGTPGSERVMGVRKDLGKLYEMAEVADFAGERVPEPVVLHSWEMKIFEIRWLQK